ncbi:MAG TPA: hypothetical protein VN915_09415 [Elusimicrobiota bacterium]|nr:hypothetical protein [Elusimicrobiota bacterium]
MDDSPKPEAAPDVPAAARPAEAPAEIVRLGLRVEEFERRLKARTLELETEIRSRERLRARVNELTQRADELQETAAALHREAVSATALSRELDETLRIASEARRQLGEALAAERGRREAAETALAESKALAEQLREGEARAEAARAAAEKAREQAEKDGAAGRAAAEALSAAEARAAAAAAEARQGRERLEAELKRRDAELKDARLHVAALRQKTDGHEAHIDSLRAELDNARELAEHSAVERAQERGRLEAELRAVREKSREVLENAESIRREGVDAFESTRELKLKLELEEEKLRRRRGSDTGSEAARAETWRAELEALKNELRARADRESRELRDALDAERARLYQDLDAERRAGEKTRPEGEGAQERVRRLRAESDERREDIQREVRGYLDPAPPPAALPPAAAAPALSPSPSPAAPPAPAAAEPPLREPWQKRDELKFLVWISVGVFLVAIAVTIVLFFQG